MGIVDSISIKRASQDGWSKYGFPTEVDVSISIKDLYENLSISRAGDWSTFHNMEYLDMLATWTGVNMNKPELERKFQLYKAYIGNYVPDLGSNILRQAQEDIANKIRKYLR